MDLPNTYAAKSYEAKVDGNADSLENMKSEVDTETLKTQQIVDRSSYFVIMDDNGDMSLQVNENGLITNNITAEVINLGDTIYSPSAQFGNVSAAEIHCSNATINENGISVSGRSIEINKSNVPSQADIDFVLKVKRATGTPGNATVHKLSQKADVGYVDSLVSEVVDDLYSNFASIQYVDDYAGNLDGLATRVTNAEGRLNGLANSINTITLTAGAVNSPHIINDLGGIEYVSNGNHTFYDYNTGSIMCQIDTTGVKSSKGFWETSDARLKNFHNDVEIDFNALSKIPKKYFTWKDSDKLQIGTSAQEVQKVYPELVNTSNDGTLSVAYDKLSIIALKAIDELHSKTQELEERLNKLEQLITK